MTCVFSAPTTENTQVLINNKLICSRVKKIKWFLTFDIFLKLPHPWWTRLWFSEHLSVWLLRDQTQVCIHGLCASIPVTIRNAVCAETDTDHWLIFGTQALHVLNFRNTIKIILSNVEMLSRHTNWHYVTFFRYWKMQQDVNRRYCALSLPKAPPLANWGKESCDMRNCWICERRALIKAD